MGGRTNNRLVCALDSERRAGRWRVFVRECHLCGAKREKGEGRQAAPSLLLRFCVCSWQSGNETHLWEGVKERGERERKIANFWKEMFHKLDRSFCCLSFHPHHILLPCCVSASLSGEPTWPTFNFPFFSLCWNIMYTTHTIRIQTRYFGMREWKRQADCRSRLKDG
jgi:hypothetical protein